MYRIRISIVLSLIAYNLVHAQYISGVTEPDRSVELIEDESLANIRFSKTITKDELRTHLSILASDEFEGRETGEKGNELAAEYIAMQFKSLGLPTIGDDNSYFQDVYFSKTAWSENEFSINGKPFKYLWDYLSFASENDDIPEFTMDEVVFLGYGIDHANYSDYKGNDLKGKVIMINKGEPVNKDSISYITGTKELSEWSMGLSKKLMLAKSKGVKLVLIIEDGLKEMIAENRRFLVSPALKLGDGKRANDQQANSIYISSTMAKEIIGSNDKKIKKWRIKLRKKAKPKYIDLDAALSVKLRKKNEILAGYNVLGYLEGSDLKDEIVVVSAHYDHLGKRGSDIYNGADDNGSGTVTVLELAEAFKTSKDNGHGPRRSILFLLLTGEEKGLLGSKYYAENPVLPLENTVVDVNIDMVGRTDKKYAGNSNYIYVIGSDRISRELHDINERINQDYTQVTLDYKYNDVNDRNRYYYRSDHYNFAKKGIPSIFFFSGVHEDYHRTSDTVDKIMFGKMEKLGRHFFHLIWTLSNMENKPSINKEYIQE